MNIIEFAKHLNISPSTVSRALNDRSEVSLKTRQLVLEKAKELGFSPNANARRLVTGRNFMIRLECPHITHVLSDYYLVELARAIENSAGDHGYGLMLSLGNPRRHADFQPVDGLIFVDAAGIPVSGAPAQVGKGSTPAVVIGEIPPDSSLAASFLRIDVIPGVREAVRYLAGLGHRRLGYIGSGQSGNSVRAALPALMEEAGFAWNPALALEAGVTQADGFRAARALLSLPSAAPTVLFCRTDVLAVGAIQAAQQMGLSVPGQVSVIGHDNLEIGALIDPPLTTVAIDIAEMAAAAVETLVGMIEKNAPPILVPRNTHLIVRASCGPAPLT